jgi:hypothetical protein
MAIISILTLFFVSLFVFWFLDKTLSTKPLFTRHPKLKLNYSFQTWEFLDYIALIVTISTATFVVLALLITLDFSFPKAVAQTLFATICTSTIAFAIFHYRIHKFYASHATAFNLLAAASTLIITLMANSIADFCIVEFTNVDAAQFSSAQKTFTFLGVVGIWAYIGMYASVPIYILVIAKEIYTFFKLERKKPAYINSYTIQTKNKNQKFNRGFVAMLGVSYSVIIYLGVVGSIASSAEVQLKKILVFSSFHLPPEACNIATSIPNTRVALIPDKKAVIAKPDKELGYTFTTEDCKLQPVKVERKKAEPIHYLKDRNNELISPKSISSIACPIRYCSAFNSGPCI